MFMKLGLEIEGNQSINQAQFSTEAAESLQNHTMASSSRGQRAVTGLMKSSRPSQLCKSCSPLSTIRHYATSPATSPSSSTAPYDPTSTTPPPTTTSTTDQTAPDHPPYTINAGILLSRPPLLTRPLTPFETSFHLYQKRLNERLALPFTRYFYHKKGTPVDNAWKARVKLRNGVASRDTGAYQAYGDMGWNDEVLLGEEGERIASVEGVRESLVGAMAEDKSAVVMKVAGEEGGGAGGAGEEGVVERIAVEERVTQADRENDRRSLARKLARTLYLVVKRKDSGWGFPQGQVLGRDSLHKSAERILVQSCGPNMNTWIVGHVPVGVHTRQHRYDSPEDRALLTRQGEKTFFMRARIMAGQASLMPGNEFGLEDFRWLTKQEVRAVVNRKYFSLVEDMMGER